MSSGAVRRALVAPGNLLAVGAAVCVGLSAVSMWWALPAAVAAFFAGREPGRTGPTVLVLVAVLAGGVVAVALVPSWLLMAGRFVAVVAVAAMLPWFAGRFWRQYQELVRAGWERAGRLEREQRLVAEQARSRERARIAQDMHDVLGHDLSLIALSAGALKLAPGLDEAHRAAAGEIRARAAASVERLGEVIGLLREEADEEAPRPSQPSQPSGTGIARLVEEAAAAGLPVVLRVEGEAGAISPAAARAAHRVVQEALTNAAKHAPGARVDVRVTHAAGETTVRVENGPAPAPARAEDVPGTGRGLIGLDERVRLTGGEFAYGPHEGGFAHGPHRDFAHGPHEGGFAHGPHGDFARGPHGDFAHGPHEGGFSVTARIPHAPPAALVHRAPATPRAAPPAALPPEHRHARSRARRALAVAVVLPLVAWALLSAALMAWDIRSARLSVLDPGDYARLRVGQDRESVGRLLPDRETTQRPVAGEPKGEGITCRYYAMTADRFDDRSGDAYRLCFRDGRLMSKEALTP